MLSTYEQFSLYVACISHDIQKLQRNVMSELGLKGPHAYCLLALSHFPEGITAARLGRIFEKDKASVSRTIAELEKMGMVERTLSGGSRYRALLTLTEQGISIAKTVNQTAQLAVEQAGEGLKEEDRAVFYRVLEGITRNLHTICEMGLEV